MSEGSDSSVSSECFTEEANDLDAGLAIMNDETDAKLADLFRSKRPQTAYLSSDPGDDYLMNHKRRGKCVIFNHRIFDEKSLNERKGTDVDVNSLKDAFETLGFEVKKYDDLKVAEMFTMLRALSKEDHSDADCFACCVMTHGDQANLWACNDKYPVDLIFSYFTADACPTLAGKPKLFFIQACRGDKLDPGVSIKVGADEPDSAHYYTIPTWADFLISYSTVPGYYSWRNTRDGSWFMQSLSEALKLYGSEISFLDLMTKVHRRVAYDFTSSMATDKRFDKQKQVPSTVHMLTRRLFFGTKTPKNRETVAITENIVSNVTNVTNVTNQNTVSKTTETATAMASVASNITRVTTTTKVIDVQQVKSSTMINQLKNIRI